MICTDIPAPTYLIFSDSIPQLIYYSHIPTAIIALVMGFFVFSNNKSLISKILLAISVVFSLWLFLNLVIWTSVNSDVITLTWVTLGMLYTLLFLLVFYFTYVFVKKKDVDFKFKIVWLIIWAPFAIFSYKNAGYFDLVNCELAGGKIYEYFLYGFEFLIVISILFFSFWQYRKVDKTFKKQVLFLTIGVEMFLFPFLFSGFISNLLQSDNIDYAFQVEQYGFFGMTFFMGMLAYMIVKFKAFRIKLLAAQALVVSLVILVGSELFFANSVTNQILILITLAISLGFGYMLIKSVKQEVERKEQLQQMSDSLAVANDQLRKLDNAKTEFISIASHQLRTPITAIKGFASLLLEGSYGEVSKPVQGALEKIFVSTERLTNLIEDLLNVSRIESGRLTFSFEKTSVEKILKELYENFLLVAKSKKLYLDLKLPKDSLPEFQMDPGKVRELISNFIDNALKYTEKGGVTVSAEIREEGAIIDEQGFVKPSEKAPYGKVVRITVSDTGIGVPKEEIPYLFRKFSRGKDTSRLHVGGTGLGLFVGKAIADAHHGATWVESDGANMGSKFIMEIPINTVD